MNRSILLPLFFLAAPALASDLSAFNNDQIAEQRAICQPHRLPQVCERVLEPSARPGTQSFHSRCRDSSEFDFAVSPDRSAMITHCKDLDADWSSPDRQARVAAQKSTVVTKPSTAGDAWLKNMTPK